MVLLMAALGVSLQALNDVMSKKHRLLRPTQRYLIEKHKLMDLRALVPLSAYLLCSTHRGKLINSIGNTHVS